MNGFSQINLYFNSKIERGKNFSVDNIEDYLRTLGSINIPNFQLIKHAWSISIKINLSQSTLEYNSLNNFNYVSILNTGEDSNSSIWNGKMVYYFIDKKEWIAQSTVKLHLIMDTVNTIKPEVDFNFNKKTHINREHKNRYSQVNKEEGFSIYGKTVQSGSSYIYQKTFTFDHGKINNFTTSSDSPSPADLTVLVSYTNNTYTVRAVYNSEVDVVIPVIIRYETYERIIDIFNEGLTPILFKSEESFVREDLDVSWNLMYKSDNDNEPSGLDQTKPVSTYLFPDESISMKYRTTGFNLFPADFNTLTSLEHADFSGENNSNEIYFVANSKKFRIATTYTPIDLPIIKEVYFCSVYYVDASTIRVDYFYYRYWKNSPSDISWNLDTLRSRKIGQALDSEINVFTSANSIYAGINDILSKDLSYNNTPFTTVDLNDLSSLDRTDPRIIKIIKLPYCPIKFSIDNGSLVAPPEWSFDSTSGFLKSTMLSFKLQNELSNAEDPLNYLRGTYFTPGINDERANISELDPKLFHSSFYQPVYVYDSFNYSFDLEKVDITKLSAIDKFGIRFVTSNTVNSRFLFDFYSYPNKLARESYDTIMNIARNNEVTIYSNQYINYLRTGYNYDVKSKERQDIGSLASLGLGAVGNIASLGLGIASGNPALAIQSGLSVTTTLTNSIINTVNSIAQREANLEQKIAQLKMQSASVSGADDLDLMEYYSENRLKYIVYKCSEKIQNVLNNLFYYSGYATDELGVPNLNSRSWFNFIACDIDINTISYIPQELIDDLAKLYAEGITVLHKNSGQWDFEQIKANWEVSIL